MVVHVSKSKQGESEAAVDPSGLWTEIRKGEQEALSELFCLFYTPLYTYGYKLVGRPGPVKDAIQELFLALWEKRGQISQAHSVKSYLFHSLRRILLRTASRHKNRVDRGRVYAEFFGEQISTVEELMVHFETRREQKRQLTRALDSLSERQKEAVFLKFYEGLSNPEIAAVMGVRQQSVYNHVSTAIGRLQAFVQVQ